MVAPLAFMGSLKSKGEEGDNFKPPQYLNLQISIPKPSQELNEASLKCKLKFFQ